MLARSLTTPRRAVPGPRSVARSRHEREAHRRLQPLRGHLRPRADGRGARRWSASGATPTIPSRAGTSAPRASPSPTCTPTPTGCGARSGGSWRPAAAAGRRSAGTRRSTWSPTTWRASSTSTGDDALGIYLGNPNAHSLGSMTHGTAMFKSFRTKNRYSATSVDQLPHQLVAHLMFGHQLLPADPRHRPHVVVPGHRRQPDGVQRLADDGARLPEPRPRPARPRRADGRARPAPHRDRQGRRRAPLRPARLRRLRPAGDAARPDRRGRGRPRGGVVRRRAGHGRRARRRLHARAGRGDERAAGRGDPAPGPRARGQPTPASSTAGSASRPGRGARCASGRSTAST